MDSRFRIRFWPTRRVKQHPPADLDLHSVPYQTAQPDIKQPVFIHQSLGRNLSEKRKRDSKAPLRTVSYRQAKPGKLPIFGGRPHKGNGPVKLQTNRRLSSGELLVTSQDSRRTLEEIREGEYIVGTKDRRDSRAQSVRSPSLSRHQQHVPLTSASAPSFTQSPTQPSFQVGWGSVPGSTTLLDIPEYADGPGTPVSVQSAPNLNTRPQRFRESTSPVEGLGLSSPFLEIPSAPQGILKSSSNSPASLLEPHEERNATIRALWKAEYSRLVSMYGQAGVDRNIAELRGDHGTPKEERRSFMLEPLPQPGWEVRDANGVTRSARNSRIEPPPPLQEDNSDESSQQRLSFISSVGYASSYTTRASIADTESINTRDDIRNMVDNMRSTYLKALDSREPSLQAVKSLKKKKKKRKSTATATSTPRTSTVVPPSPSLANPSTPEPQQQRSVSAQDPSPPLHSQRNTRNFTSPVGGINKLPAIEASPSRDREPEMGLTRADSSTLGALMGEHKRSSIQKRRSKRASRRLSGQQPSAPNISPSRAVLQHGAEPIQDKDMSVPEDDFKTLYKDMFRASTQDFWQSAPTFTPTLGLPSMMPSPERPPPPVPTSS